MDWRNPDTWKLPATPIDYWKTMLVGGLMIIGGLATIFRQTVLKPFRWARLWSITRRARHRALRFVQNEKMSAWGPDKQGDELATKVFGCWHVTNTSDRDIVVLRARLEGFQADHFVTTQGSDGTYSSMLPVPAGQMAKVWVNAMFTPPITFSPPITPHKEALGVDVIFTDNFGNEYRVPSRFAPMAGPPSIVTDR